MGSKVNNFLPLHFFNAKDRKEERILFSQLVYCTVHVPVITNINNWYNILMFYKINFSLLIFYLEIIHGPHFTAAA